MEEKLNKLLSAVSPLDDAAMEKARERQAQLAKPPGSLGRLEDLSVQLAGITGQVHNKMEKTHLLVLPPTTAWWRRACPAHPSP